MTIMNSQPRSVSAALDMVEAAISSLEQQAKMAKLYEEQQKKEQIIIKQEQNLKKEVADPERKPVVPPENGVKLKLDSRQIAGFKKHLSVNEKYRPDDSEDSSESSDDVGRVMEHPRKKHKSCKKVRSSSVGVLLPRNISPKKPISDVFSSEKHHKRHSHSKTSSKREKNNNSNNYHLPESDRKSRSTGDYSKPTLSSKMREQLIEKPKKKDKSIPFIPSGNQGKNFHIGIRIQNKLGQLKSEPLDRWTTKNDSSESLEESPSRSTILERALTKS